MRRGLLQLSEPMLARARQRLSVVALLLGAAFFALNLTGTAWFAWGGYRLSSRYPLHLDLVSACLWLILAALARVRRLSHVAVLRLGQAFVVLICLSLSTVTALNTYWFTDLAPVWTWAPLLIATYPLLIPTPPRKTLVVVTAAAATAPAGVALAALLGASPHLGDLLAVSFGPAMAAVIAVVGSDLIYSTSIDVAELGEQATRLGAVVAALGDAMVLRDDRGEVVFESPAARALLGPQLNSAPLVLQRAVETGREGTVVGSVEGRPETFHVTRCELSLFDRRHELMLIRRLTAEMDHAEVASFRKLLRSLSHELSNTVAPMSSVLRSLRVLIERDGPGPHLGPAIDSLQDRVTHLAEFLSEYASLARLPHPRPREVAWRPFLERLHPFAAMRLPERLPTRPGRFDPAQIEHVLLNLWKNAVEADSPPDDISLTLEERSGGFELCVVDRGRGLSTETADRALLPFYSTRPGGTGLGLSLCREVIVAHGGWLSLSPRDGGGAIVRVWLPYAPADASGALSADS